MQNEHHSSKTFGPRNVALLIFFIFILLIAYKQISSNIQEEKEKSVIQERAVTALEEKRPLQECLDTVENRLQRRADGYRKSVLENAQPTSSWMRLCMASNNNDASKCVPDTMEDAERQIQKDEVQAEIDRNECYRRYK